jgi:hypothetical protein
MKLKDILISALTKSHKKKRIIYIFLKLKIRQNKEI